MGLRLSILVFLWASGASASLGDCWRKLWGEWTAREVEQRILDDDRRLTSHASALTALTGRHLSATQISIQRINQLIDSYFLLGDIGPLVNLYSGLVRRVELAYLRRKHNLMFREKLASAIPYDFKEFEKEGFLTRDQAALLSIADDPEKNRWAESTDRRLEKENLAFEGALGREFEEFKQVRKHLLDLMTGSNGFLLSVVGQSDNRTTAHAVTRVAAAMPALETPVDGATPLRSFLEERKRKVDERVAGISAQIEEVQKILNQLYLPKPVSKRHLRRILELSPSDNVRALLGRNEIDDVGREILKAEAEMLRDRLLDARSLVEQAFTLDKKIGMHFGDFTSLAHLIPQGSLRPTYEEVSAVVYNSAASQKAMNLSARFKQFWAFVDGNLFYGNIGAMLPSLGGSIDSPDVTLMQKFIFRLFRDFYLQHFENQYFGALGILKKTPGGGQKLRRAMENLNGGTRDEFLVVFAQRSDLSSLWKVIKKDAESDKDSDHQKLYERMLVAEKRALEYGPISPIGGSSYSRYVVASVLNGAIFYAASSWWVAPTARSIWHGVFGAVKAAPRNWRAWLIDWFRAPEAIAEEAPRPLRLNGFGLEVQENLLVNLERLIDLSAPAKVRNDASRQLWTLEKVLSGKSDAELSARF